MKEKVSLILIAICAFFFALSFVLPDSAFGSDRENGAIMEGQAPGCTCPCEACENGMHTACSPQTGCDDTCLNVHCDCPYDKCAPCHDYEQGGCANCKKECADGKCECSKCKCWCFNGVANNGEKGCKHQKANNANINSTKPNNGINAGNGGYEKGYSGQYFHIVEDYTCIINSAEVPRSFGSSIVSLSFDTPFRLEVKRFFNSRSWGANAGFGWLWMDSYFIFLWIAEEEGWRRALVEFPNGTCMRWVDPGPSGVWVENMHGIQSLHMSLYDEPGDCHLIVDRYGNRYHFKPNTGTRPFLQYLCDWLEDFNGNRITLVYDADGYLIEATDQFSCSLFYQWETDEYGYKTIRYITLPDGKVIEYQHLSGSIQDIQVIYPNGDIASYGMGQDEDGLYLFFNDPRGTPGSRKDRVYLSTYTTVRGHCRGVKDEEGNVKYGRIRTGETELEINYRCGKKFRYQCNPGSGLLASAESLIDGSAKTYTFAPADGSLSEEFDTEGKRTGYEYDANFNTTKITYPDNTYEAWAYNSLNRPESYQDRNECIITYSYDVKGNLTQITYPDSSFESWTYNSRGQAISYTDRNGNTTTYTYGDPYGNLTGITLPAELGEPNPVEQYFYNIHGLKIQEIDPEGRVTTYEYDDAFRLIKTTFADGTTEEITYGSMDLGNPDDPVGDAGLVIERKDRNGNKTTYSYGCGDREEAIIDPEGGLVEFSYYHGTGLLSCRMDHGDGEWYEYDDQCRILHRIRKPEKDTLLVWIYEYDTEGREKTITDPYGYRTIKNYDVNGRLFSEEREIGGSEFAITYYQYDPNGNTTAITDPRGNVWTFEYDCNNRKVKEFDPSPFNQLFRYYEYDPEGNLLRSEDQLGNGVAYTYTTRNKIKEVTYDVENTLTNTLTYSYFLDDQVKKITNAGSGGESTYTYDCCGRVTSERTKVDGGSNDIIRTYTYDGNGNQTSITDGEGHVTSYLYDGRNRLIQETDPLGYKSTFSYDDDGSSLEHRLCKGQGSVFKTSDPNGETATAVYDGLGRTIATLDNLLNRTSFFYDETVIRNGAVYVIEKIIDRERKITQKIYDGLHRLRFAVDPLSQETSYEYDKNNNLIAIYDPKENPPTLFEYDERNLRTKTTFPDPEPNSIVYGYDAAHRLTSRTDQQGVVTEYTYDKGGRLTGIIYPDGMNDEFQYDLAGRRTFASSERYDNSVTWDYDPADRILGEAQNGKTVSYSYDRNSQATSISYPSGTLITMSYTPRGELDLVFRDGFLIADHDYDKVQGRLIEKKLGNGTITSLEYSDLGWRSKISHVRAVDKSIIIQDSDPNIKKLPLQDILTLSYGYDREGNSIFQENLTAPIFSEQYEYDDAYQLISWKRGRLAGTSQSIPNISWKGRQEGITRNIPNPTNTQKWTLDANGNWDSTTIGHIIENRHHNEVNELVQRNSTVLQYDDKGNLIDDGTYLYSWDINNLLTEVRLKSDTSLLARYTYDALQRRVSKYLAKTGLTTLFIWGGTSLWQCLEEYEKPDGSSYSLSRAFIYGSYINEPITMTTGTGNYYYHTNKLYSIAAITDSASNVVEKYRYTAYGKPTILDGHEQEIAKSAIGNTYMFNGRTFDSETGLYYFGSRFYSPSLGRWLSRESGNDTFRLYVFLQNNPFQSAAHYRPSVLQYASTPNEMFVRFEAKGEVGCDTKDGRFKIINKVTEHCKGGEGGDCVQRHEKKHIEHNQECCRRYYKCLKDNNNVEDSACESAYKGWFKDPDQENWDECEAYKVSGKCLEDRIKNHCKKCELKISAECCRELAYAALGNRNMQGKHCPGDQKPCPFTEKGDIIKKNEP